LSSLKPPAEITSFNVRQFAEFMVDNSFARPATPHANSIKLSAHPLPMAPAAATADFQGYILLEV
jgi:hypothetical protein